MSNDYIAGEDPNATDQERQYFLSVISTFQSYRNQSLLRVAGNENSLENLSDKHKTWLSKYNENLQSYKACIEINSQLICNVTQNAHNMFDNVNNDNAALSESDVGVLTDSIDRVQSVFKQLMRDWSSEGAMERLQCYQPIVDEILLQYPVDETDRHKIDVLVPGAGLGRLAFEIASRGFNCQGNEFNLFMLIVSYFVLNRCQIVDEHRIYPWIHQYCNNLSADHQMTSVRFPDVRPMPSERSAFSMCAGDFIEVYNEPNTWHCVATCFFIDCAANVVTFIETIHRILVPGGLWINLGPLMYHYADMKSHESVEPSYDVICDVIRQVGFVMEKSTTGLKSRYCQNPNSMLQYEYDSVFFVCRKNDN